MELAEAVERIESKIDQLAVALLMSTMPAQFRDEAVKEAKELLKKAAEEDEISDS